MLSYPVLFLYRFRYRSSVVLLCVGVVKVVFRPSEDTQYKCVHLTTVVYDVAHKTNECCLCVCAHMSPPSSSLPRTSIEVFRLGQEGVRLDACAWGGWRSGRNFGL